MRSIDYTGPANLVTAVDGYRCPGMLKGALQF